MMRFDRFTEKAQEAAMRAYEILQRYKHAQVDAEHLFLALLEQPTSVVSQILGKLGIPTEVVGNKVKNVLEAIPKTDHTSNSSKPQAQIFVTRRVKHILERAAEESSKLGDEYIDTVHIFLAIAGEKDTSIASILRKANITQERIYEVIKGVADSKHNSKRITKILPEPEKVAIHAV